MFLETGFWKFRLEELAVERADSHSMSAPEENILVVRRSLFDQIGAFEGFRADPNAYLAAFFAEGNNFFVPRSSAEEDPSLKQIIPYAVFRHGGRILHYVRGGKSGEKRLVAKGSIGIGGHINDGDLHVATFDDRAYRTAVEREISEELQLGGGFTDRIVGLINDDSTEVGRVHLGVVHVVDLESDDVLPGESAITQLAFLEPVAVTLLRDRLETWSQILVDGWDEIHAPRG